MLLSLFYLLKPLLANFVIILVYLSFSIIAEIIVRLKIFKPISQYCLMHRKIYSTLVLLSALSLLIGSIALRLGNLVPDSLTGLTIFAIIILATYGILLLYFDGSRFQFIGVILAVVSFLISSNSAHLNGLSNFYSSSFQRIFHFLTNLYSYFTLKIHTTTSQRCLMYFQSTLPLTTQSQMGNMHP